MTAPGVGVPGPGTAGHGAGLVTTGGNEILPPADIDRRRTGTRTMTADTAPEDKPS